MLTARKRQPKRDGIEKIIQKLWLFESVIESSASPPPPPLPATLKDYGYNCSGGASVD